jgi:hypothetical protein
MDDDLPLDELLSAESRMDGAETLFTMVCDWDDMEWVKYVGKIAVHATKNERLRLFWASSFPEARTMMELIKHHVPLIEVRENNSIHTTLLHYLDVLVKWDEEEIEIVDSRTRVVLEALTSYLEDFQISYGFRKHVEKQSSDMVEVINKTIEGIAVSFKGHTMSELDFPDPTKAKPPPDLRIELSRVLKSFCYIVSYASRVTYPPEIDKKFRTFRSRTERIWHPNVVLMVAAMIQHLFEDFGVIKTPAFQCAIHLSIWSLGLSGPAPFTTSKDNDRYVWERVADLLGVNYYKCLEGHKYRYG